MDCLELNIRRLILSDLASNVGESKGNQEENDVSTAVELVTSKVETRAIPESSENEDAEEGERVFMSNSRVQCNIGFAELALNLPDAHVNDTLPVLVDILRDVAYIDFDRCLTWEEWALPDQLVFATVTALLRVASSHQEYREQATRAIVNFCARVVTQVQSGEPVDVLTQFAPAFHGFYRAIISTSFNWSPQEWSELSDHLNALYAVEAVDRLNRLLIDAVPTEEEDIDQVNFISTLVLRYISRGRPLNGYFIVCCVTEALWTILAQALGRSHASTDTLSPALTEAAAANKAWQILSRTSSRDAIFTEPTYRAHLKTTLENAMRSFSDLLGQVEDMDFEPSEDSYAWETMSESLKLAAVCSVALGELDKDLYSRVKLLLSTSAPMCDNMVREAALKATAVLVRNFPDTALSMANHLRRFVTSPLSIFEFEFVTGTRTPPPLVAAAKCLALCIDLAPGDDLVMSYMYSLLNCIAATSKDPQDTSGLLMPVLGGSADYSTVNSMDTGLRGLSDDEKRTVGISTISVATRLALEFKSEEVIRLTISMLLQRLRSAEPTVEAAIAYNLVDLALAAPEASFAEVIRAFSGINCSAHLDDPRYSNNMVLAAQTRLAQELRRRPELYTVYLIELLTLFSDKGVAVQNLAIQNHHAKTEDMVEQLGSLLLPIDALLTQSDYHPEADAPAGVVTLFRNMWFLCTLFRFAADDKNHSALEWQRPALARIAMKTPSLVMESNDTIVSDLEYNTVIRQEYVDTVIATHRALLTKLIPQRLSETRNLNPGQIIFLLSMHDIEAMRSALGLPASLVNYFANNGLNNNTGLFNCMEAIAEKVIRDSVSELNGQAARQSLPEDLSRELRTLLTSSTHRIQKARDIAARYLNRLITSFPSLMCDPTLVFAILEVLTLLRRACENQYTDEDNPTYAFRSDRADITLQLPDNYAARNEMLANLQHDSSIWFELALSRAPLELHATLQKYLAVNQVMSLTESSELGASLALQYGKAVGPINRKLASLSTLSHWELDRAKLIASQIASKGYFAGEVSGYRLAQPDASQPQGVHMRGHVPYHEIASLKAKMTEIMQDVREKRGTITVRGLKHLLFRCASTLIFMDMCDYELVHYLVALPFEAFSQSAISAGIETWTWVISEKPDYEVALMAELSSAWILTIKHEKGMFSRKLNYADPFVHPVEYSPTDKHIIDRGAHSASSLLTPHVLIIQLLFSRMQAARYLRPGLMLLFQRIALASARAHKQMSTHPLAREARFSLLLFGLEILKGSDLDLYREHLLRYQLYRTAYSWFSVRPQWSYGANRVQLDSDIRQLSEFLAFLQADLIRGRTAVTSLYNPQLTPQSSQYVISLKNLNLPLKLLVEHEISRLSVWANPLNDPRRGSDHINTLEKAMLDSAWISTVRKVWDIDPAIAVFLAERFHHPSIQAEVGRLVRSSPHSALQIPEALHFLVGDKLDTAVRRDLKYLLLWAPVPPVLAVTFFEKRYNTEPLILQYAHRVLEEHPVELTFFFVPQIVQALRYDELGYVSQFILETAKISQLFCHQIIWNMKANCYKDDAGEMEDPMKPILDSMIDMVVNSLSGEAKAFYDKEFGFFNEVTSISGKLKPFIKKTKPEKKAKIDEEMAKIQVEVGVYLPSNPDGNVVDIDKKSGRPLQSHAKAPFMATFKVRKARILVDINSENLFAAEGQGQETIEEYDIWQQAIFKVGDDCRQDVLALQVIAMFKNIFTSVGLPLYLYPYRVTATAPGCGVIDVVPNATSRDEMGRAKVNDLLDFFVAKYGGEDTIDFQKARLNFIQSMAAYSVVCYILQVKDRHNGNIMIDGEGHIVHIDFGFLFDIDKLPRSNDAPAGWLISGCCEYGQECGVKFEPNSFKLTHEMVVLMGGRYSQGYQLFQQMTVKAFLAIRPHADQLVSTVQLMLDTSLPSFKGEPTIRRLRERFAPDLNDRQAAEFMMGIVRNAHENVRSTAYDEFQRIQNGIPYK